MPDAQNAQFPVSIPATHDPYLVPVPFEPFPRDEPGRPASARVANGART
jgi:hypothetical protein